MKEHDYMNDPRLDEFGDMPFPARQVRAWRLAVQDEKAGMTLEQRMDYYAASRKETDAICAELGFKLNYVESVVTA